MQITIIIVFECVAHTCDDLDEVKLETPRKLLQLRGLRLSNVPKTVSD